MFIIINTGRLMLPTLDFSYDFYGENASYGGGWT